jgi:hypothetical protein
VDGFVDTALVGDDSSISDCVYFPKICEISYYLQYFPNAFVSVVGRAPSDKAPQVLDDISVVVVI